MPSVISAGTTTGTALSLTSDTSGELQIRTNNGSTTAMTLTTGGNVGIGTVSPATRLDVNGALTATSVNSQNTFGFKNRFINGDMSIDQRNVGASVTNSVGNIYTLDRWLSTTVASSCSVQQVTGSTGNNRAVRVTGASGNATTQLSQRIEANNIYDCASQTVTVSFTISGSVSGSVSVRFLYPTATDNFTTQTEPVAGTTVSFTTTPTRYSVTRVLDANANKGLNVVFERGATGAGVTWTLEEVQIEKGSVATSFDILSIGQELMLCQRYYQQLNLGAETRFPVLISTGSTTSSPSIPYPAGFIFRATPTATVLVQPTLRLIRNISDAGDVGYSTLSVGANSVPGYGVSANAVLSTATQILAFNTTLGFSAEL